MKDNIDLTDGRDFPDRAPEIRDVLFGTRGQKLPEWAVSFTLRTLPWELVQWTSDIDIIDSSYDPLFPTGSKEQILHREGVQNAMSREHCDRCGKVINLFPWDKQWGVCRKCREALDREFLGRQQREMPWERNSNIITVGDLL